VPVKLLDFSWLPAVPLPLRKPISPSSFSSVFLFRPHILHATMSSPARMMAPPTPTTTPMTVFLVLVLMPDDLPELSLRDAAAVDLEEPDVLLDVCELVKV